MIVLDRNSCFHRRKKLSEFNQKSTDLSPIRTVFYQIRPRFRVQLGRSEQGQCPLNPVYDGNHLESKLFLSEVFGEFEAKELVVWNIFAVIFWRCLSCRGRRALFNFRRQLAVGGDLSVICACEQSSVARKRSTELSSFEKPWITDNLSVINKVR